MKRNAETTTRLEKEKEKLFESLVSLEKDLKDYLGGEKAFRQIWSYFHFRQKTVEMIKNLDDLRKVNSIENMILGLAELKEKILQHSNQQKKQNS